MEPYTVPSNMNPPEGGDYGNRSDVSYSNPVNGPRGECYSGNCNDETLKTQQPDPKMGSIPVSDGKYCSNTQDSSHVHQHTSSNTNGEYHPGQREYNHREADPESRQNYVHQHNHHPAANNANDSYESVHQTQQNQLQAGQPQQAYDPDCNCCHPVEYSHTDRSADRSEKSNEYRQATEPISAQDQMKSPWETENQFESQTATKALNNIQPNLPDSCSRSCSQVNLNSSENPPVDSASVQKPTPVIKTFGLQKAPRGQDCVASLLVLDRPTNSSASDIEKFNPSSLTNLNFKEKQLALSAVKKAASNLGCIQMFQDKDKNNSGKINRRDFQMVMDRIGVLNGLSSREIDAVFKGFSTNRETELDYRRFASACRYAVENDHRLARMAQK